MEIQKALKAKNAELPDNRRMEFRIGVNLGDAIEDEDWVYGDGVNIAASIEGMAEPGGICISRKERIPKNHMPGRLGSSGNRAHDGGCKR